MRGSSMVVQKSWLPVDLRLPAGPQAALGILAFEAAAAMSKLLSLHRSLSDQEVSRLRSDAMRSAGVAYLNSTDQAFLLKLACAELVVSLDAAAAAVARLGLRCGIDFGGVYTCLKAGAADARLDLLVAKGLRVKAKKMERLVAATAKLCSEMEALDELVAVERKINVRGWSRLSGPIPAQPVVAAAAQAGESPGADSLRQELKTQRLKVRRLKEESLWNQSYEKAVSLMARAACAVFVRICTIFGPFVPSLPPPLPSATTDSVQTRLSKLLHPRSAKAKASSGPITRRDGPSRVHPPMSNSCPIIGLRPSGKKSPTDWRKLLDAPPSTVGGAGLDQQYANVIVSAEELLRMEAEGRQEEAAAERAEMYEMLPAKLRAAVRSKLREWWRDPGPLDAGLAHGWKDAVDRIMAWLGPMARDTVQWQSERNMDRTRRFDGAPRVYALQTLRWANKEKAEAAIVEVLVALSCICWYEERRRGSVRH
ncbi:protein PSK SIMULATOR 1-like [Phragmites australis]|uniref:protein PSK SIMULATOR 1-like n=1 Tax=Phragmites australis TaxID=29695 RepID=UPI002D7A2805|nr:protein PSK SIMULATOR 1-like [Phragmites australis]